MAESVATSQSKPSVWSSFFGNVIGSVEQTVSEILPNWTAAQLGLQTKDQLERQTFDETQAPPRVETIQGPKEIITAPFKTTALKIGGLKISWGVILIACVGLLGAGLIMKGR